MKFGLNNTLSAKYSPLLHNKIRIQERLVITFRFAEVWKIDVFLVNLVVLVQMIEVAVLIDLM